MAESEVDSAPLVVARAAGKRFADGTLALQSIELSIQRQEFVTIVGPSGCGKSTFLRLVAGLTEASAGTLTVADVAPVVARRASNDMAFVFQDPNLLPWRTVERNVSLPLELANRNSEVRSEHVNTALQMVGLEEFRRSFPSQLSGGMRMRVSIARALVTQPRLLLMDEPFGALDALTREKMNLELLDIWQKSQKTIIFVTHGIQEAVFLGTHVAVMSPSPARLADYFEVDLPHPRGLEIKTQENFGIYARRIYKLLGMD